MTSMSAGSGLTVVPNLLNLVIGESHTLHALDASGQPVTGLSWASSDSNVVSLSTDDPPVLTALAAGHITITAGTAAADVTVWPSSLPMGTVIWSNPGNSSGVSYINPAVPSASGVADMFAVQNDCNLQAITMLLIGHSYTFDQNPSWNLDDPNSSAGTGYESVLWHDMGPAVTNSPISYNYPVLTPNPGGPTARIGPNLPPVQPKKWGFMKSWGAQIACEASVDIALASDQQDQFKWGSVGLVMGVGGSTIGGVGGLLLVGSATIGDAMSARNTCVPLAWGPGHF